MKADAAKALLLSSLIAVGAATLEAASWLWLRHDRLDQILSVLQRDPGRIWRVRPNLSTTFFGAIVHTDSRGFRVHSRAEPAPSGQRPFVILDLGASPSFGWGVEDAETYSALLEERLNRNGSGMRFRVINGSQIGYSSFQGLRLLQEVAPVLKPDMILVSYVINDVDAYRFFFDNNAPDSQVQLPPAWTITANNWLERSRFVRALNRALLSALGAGDQTPGACFGLSPRPPRVTAEEYGKNLRRFAGYAREHKIEPVFLKIPVNLPRGEDPLDPQAATKELKLAEELHRQGGCAAALPHALEAWRLDSQSSGAACLLDRCHAESGEKEKEEELRIVWKRLEANQASRRAERYNRIMESAASDLRAGLVDIVERYREVKGTYLFVDPKLDTIHPNRIGHQAIADALEQYFLRAKPEWKIGKP